MVHIGIYRGYMGVVQGLYKEYTLGHIRGTISGMFLT